MKPRVQNRFLIVFLTTVFIVAVFIAKGFATAQEFKMIKELEEQEKAVPEVIERPVLRYEAGDLKDPFTQPVIKKEETKPKQVVKIQPPVLTVQGVIWGGRFNQAIINDKVLKAGGTIQGAKILSIDKNGIVVLFEGMQFNLSSPASGTVPSKKQGSFATKMKYE